MDFLALALVFLIGAVCGILVSYTRCFVLVD